MPIFGRQTPLALSPTLPRGARANAADQDVAARLAQAEAELRSLKHMIGHLLSGDATTDQDARAVTPDRHGARKSLWRQRIAG